MFNNCTLQNTYRAQIEIKLYIVSFKENCDPNVQDHSLTPGGIDKYHLSQSPPFGLSL